MRLLVRTTKKFKCFFIFIRILNKIHEPETAMPFINAINARTAEPVERSISAQNENANLPMPCDRTKVLKIIVPLLAQIPYSNDKSKMRRPIFLVGYMAAGKTTLGKYAARRIGREFIDLDRYIESRFMRSIPELFAQWGEEKFRKIERNMLHEAGEFDNVLIATGGGTPCFFDNMDYMKQSGTVVYLICSVDTICRRLMAAKVKRPLVANTPKADLPTVVSQMLAKREPFYMRSHHVFVADEYESAEALAQATELLKSLSDQPMV